MFVIVFDCIVDFLCYVVLERIFSKINEFINIISILKWMINYILLIFKLVNFIVWKNDNKKWYILYNYMFYMYIKN